MTSTTVKPTWWPFALSDPESQAMQTIAASVDDIVRSGNTRELDLAAYGQTINALDQAMSLHVDAIVARDGLPHHAHLINGWGDATLADGTRLVDGLASFVQHNSGQVGVILQKHPEGEVHPWQSFAYAFMAGADPDALLGDSHHSIRSVAKASRWLLTTEGEELGHLLYALARLGDDASNDVFTLIDGTEVGLNEIAAKSVQAHISGHFDVCRKAHLTEGLCSAVARFEQLAPLRPVVEAFLQGQLESLLLLATITEQAARHRRGESVDTTLVHSMQKTLALGPMVENHYYWAGHVFEIAGLAMIDGFEISDRNRTLMSMVANQLNQHAEEVLQATHFPTSFLHFGHYRRGLTLLAAAERAAHERRPLRHDDLSDYTVDFSSLPTPSTPAPLPHYDHPFFVVAEAPPGVSEKMQAIIDAYDGIADEGFELRGGFSHLRRVIPAGWPRTVHFELLENADGTIDADLHFESPAAADVAASFATEIANGQAGHSCPPVLWDSTWYEGLGRLQLKEVASDPQQLAKDFQALINATVPMLNDRVSELTTPAHPDERVAWTPTS